MQDTSWFESWFNSPYYHLLYKDRDEEEAKAFIERLTRHLHLPKQARILDLACGKGRHSISLADLGYQVLGIDIAPENIAYANNWARPGLTFAVHDMRQPLSQEPFGAVLNLFTSFGYFDREEEHQAALQTMALALTEDGKLVIDYLNIDQVIAQLVNREVREIEGIQFQIERRLNGNFLRKEIRVIDPSVQHPLVFSEQVAMFRLQDFEKLLDRAGLVVRETAGNYQLEEYDALQSPRLILICTRK
ncbi:MAG: class I SAM-dependent methyltransferase [Bacteroidota bacterium]